MITIAQTEKVRVSLFEDFINAISTPLGFIIFIGILTIFVLVVLHIIRDWNKIMEWFVNSQFEDSEQNAMYSKEEWRKRNILLGILLPLLTGFIVSIVFSIFLSPPTLKFFSLISAILFGVLLIPGGLIFGRKYLSLCRMIKKRYNTYLSEKEEIMAILKDAFKPQLHLPEIESRFTEIGFANGQGKKLLKLLSGKIIDSEY